MLAANAFPSRAEESIALEPDRWERERVAQLAEPKSPEPFVHGEIQLLVRRTPEARLAAWRLVDRAPAVLPRLHAVLLDPKSPDTQKVLILGVLGRAGFAASAPPIVQFGERRIDSRREVLDALRGLRGHTPSADAFVLALIEDRRAPALLRQSALQYLAVRRHPDAPVWADWFREDPDANYRIMALYADAIAGRAGTADALFALLREGITSKSERFVFLALARTAPPAAFDARVPARAKRSAAFEMGRRLSRLWSLEGPARTEQALGMLGAEETRERTLSIRDLIEQGHAASLAPYAHSGVPLELGVLVRTELRHAGYDVKEGETVEVVKRGPTSR